MEFNNDFSGHGRLQSKICGGMTLMRTVQIIMYYINLIHITLYRYVTVHKCYNITKHSVAWHTNPL